MNQFLSMQTGKYTGALMYRQEDGYAVITMIVSVAPNEHSHVISHVYKLSVSEEGEHLLGVDLYHFAVPSNSRIQLAIVSPYFVLLAKRLCSRRRG